LTRAFDTSGLQRTIRYFETLAAQDIDRIGDIYAPGAFFKDPFHEVRGVQAIGAIYRRMFEQVDEPRFVIASSMSQDADAFLTWHFHFRMKHFSRAPQTIHGASHLRFDPDGRIHYHRDYWDSAEELYEKLPLLGGLIRILRRRAAS